jgi:spermidine synthase
MTSVCAVQEGRTLPDSGNATMVDAPILGFTSRSHMRRVLFAATAFLSALQLFLVEPLVGRMVLPIVGGSAAVWNTCLVVFQALLLLGYAWSHFVARWPIRLQVIAQVVVLLIPASTLPLTLSAGWVLSGQGSPQVPLIGLLVSSVGPLFFALSTNSSILQRWFAGASRSGADPYFLYGVSSAGSLVGLLAYPAVFEPFFSVTQHRLAWSTAYAIVAFLVICCGVASLPTDADRFSHRPELCAPKPSAKAVQRWIWLAFVPSSLTIGCTTYLSTELAPVPLLWVLPLALYLVTFVISFAGQAVRPRDPIVQWLSWAALALATAHITGHASNAVALTLHLGALFIFGLLCHGRLADSRPSPEHLTGFYFWVSIGGVAGGLFNALVAPALFQTALEYPLVLVLASVVVAALGNDSSRTTRLLAAAPLVSALFWVTAASVPQPSIACLVPFATLALSVVRRPSIRVASYTLGTLLFLQLSIRASSEHVVVQRSFYSVLRVAENYEPGYRALIHGTTVHGMQAYDKSLAKHPVTYYTEQGPLGQMFSALSGRLHHAHVGVVGLGVGEIATYAEGGQQWTFFELDPLVEHVAKTYFTYLRDAAVTPGVVIGDARQTLAAIPPGSLDVLVLDAFTSDAIPVHLLTREAVAEYSNRLGADGLIAVHVSNRFVNLARLLAGVAIADRLCGVEQVDAAAGSPVKGLSRRPSHWVVLAASCKTLLPLTLDRRWTRLDTDLRLPVWSDERADVLTVVRWPNVLGGMAR